MIENGEDEWGGVRAQNATPSSRELLERIQYNRELSSAGSLVRRRVGALTPSDAEVQAVYAAREAAVARQLEEALHGDLHRRRVVSMRYYDTLMAATTDDVFQESQPLSDVEARRVVLGPLRKLVAVLATRQCFASLLRYASGVGEALHTDRISPQLAVQSALPSPSPLPNISTLLRGIALPDVGASRRFPGFGHGDPAYDFVEAPRSRPWHEPFAFRLKHFTPVPMPSFVLDVAAQAEREVRRGDGESPSAQEGDDVPTLMAVQPSVALTNGSHFTSCTTSARPAKAPAHGRSPAGTAPATE
ncbi:conserved hypothetical protein [Leishmania infantum JPCM5]|uniref:Uncharacterized protein n=2 Tax=Leishmania infantum TaxID=5671 RepID=A4I1U5_LEIIN|nr:conserved hypothetical protein [Leishmania infantum JPCM5]CAC9495643.1 hypothetical_protein_-_conserved [Leishmania infantum]CAM68726.1 conserved hypothetical protein [Leishmania infantum JPCM5]SUZ42596.1 hypothetical_protein_-_conserved [Leishmania infantum]|eukprot:XP_001470356.1 conserved hypothetical protein [Leishmania infantum JPCM5]